MAVFQQDDQGQWWRINRSGTRNRSEKRTCQFCSQEFVAVCGSKNKFCSYSCSHSIGTPEIKQSVANEYLSGLTVGELGKKYEVRSTTISKWLAEYNITTRTDHLVDVGHKEDIISYYSNGRSVIEISSLLGVSRKKITSILRSAGLMDTTVQHRKDKPKKNPYSTVTIYPDDPYFCMAKKQVNGYGGLVLQHRYVMAQHLGRALQPDETVHHKDGNRQNNELSNLELWEGRHGKGQRLRDLVLEDIKRLPPEDIAYILQEISKTI